MDLGNSVELVKTGFIKGRNLEMDRKYMGGEGHYREVRKRKSTASVQGEHNQVWQGSWTMRFHLPPPHRGVGQLPR